MKSVKSIISYWGQLLYLPVNFMSKLSPRDSKLWLFGSTFGRRFADNPRYLYNYICQHSSYAGVNYPKGDEISEADKLCCNIRPIWMSHDKDLVRYLNKHGYPACYYRSLKGIIYALRAGAYFYDNYTKDISYPLSGGALHVNMWHGIPLKKIQHDNIHDSFRHPKNILERIKNLPRNISDEKPSDYILTTSDELVSTFSSAFKTDNVLTSGYPRIDSICTKSIRCILTPSERASKAKLLDMKRKFKGSKICLYVPTFRDSESDFFDVVDLDKLNDYLEDNNLILVLKLHMKSKLNSVFADIKGERVLPVSPDDDVNRFLGKSDLLITDYSSVYFDYLWTDKPIVFFNYDIKKYLSDSREMYYDYDTVTPGYKAGTMDELFEAIEDSFNIDIYRKDRIKLRNLIFDDTYGEGKTIASYRLAKEVSDILR